MNERLMTFLYLLLRDGRNNAGEIEQFVRQAEATVKDFSTPYAVTYSNEFLEGYAKELAGRLVKA